MDDAELRRRLVAGDPLIGTVVSLPDVALAELTASVVDFVCVRIYARALTAVRKEAHVRA